VLGPNARVATLIDTATGGWHLDFIQCHFPPEEVARIRSVILSPLWQPDKIIWQGIQSRCFNVKSAYHMEMRRLAQERRESSGEKGSEVVWRILWSLNAPLVLKNF
jgi:hypothetical protein